jgi:hypothetical protein
MIGDTHLFICQKIELFVATCFSCEILVGTLGLLYTPAVAPRAGLPIEVSQSIDAIDACRRTLGYAVADCTIA